MRQLTTSKLFLLVFSIFSVSNILPFFNSKMTIENATETPFYGAVYYATKNSAVQSSKLVPLPARHHTTITLPMGRPFRKRLFFVGQTHEDLPKKIERDDENQPRIIPPIPVGIGCSNNLILSKSDIGLEINPADIKEAKQVRDYLRSKLAKKSPHYEKVATVSHYPDSPCPQEAAYIAKRNKVTRKALSKFVNRHIDSAHMPRVSLVAGGGGIRATLMTLGILKGLSQIGLLNGLTYMAGVSGGTWAITSWLLANSSIDEVVEAHKDWYHHLPNKNEFIRKCFGEYNNVKYQKALFGHGSGLTDLYSVCVSKIFLKPVDPHYYGLMFSQLTRNLHPALYPFPICTAVTRKEEMRERKYHWLEFSPFDIRLATSEHSIPTWAFMRRFDNGVSIDKTPEPWLGYMMGIWGSAFSVSLDDVLVRLSEKLNRWIPDKVLDWLMNSKLGRSKRFAAKIPNFTYNIKGSSELSNKTLIPMTDAGHEDNLPITPLLHAGRNQDLIIIINPGINDYLNLHGLKQTYKDLRIQYPHLKFDVDTALGQAITFWPSTDHNTPNLIHLSLHKDTTFDATYDPRSGKETNTMNFRYTREQVANLTGLSEHLITKNKQLFVDAIKTTIKKKEHGVSLLKWISSRVKGWFTP